MRINARLDEDHRRKLEYLKRTTGARVSDIVKQAIDFLYDHTEQSGTCSEKLLRSSGFVGCGSGPENLSMKYKEQLTKTVSAKHGHR